MLKPLKLTCPEDKLLFTSDMHYGHNRDFIYGPRGFKDVTEHNDALVHRWNEVCDDHSTVFHLGDLIFKADEAAFWALLRRLRFGHLYLMLGNHVSGQKQAYAQTLAAHYPSVVMEDHEAEVYPLHTRLDNGHRNVTFLPEYVELVANKETLVLCHYPIVSHHHIGHGVTCLVGHTHGNLPLTHRDTGKGRRLDVGIESVGRPITLREVKAILAKRDLDIVDHHGREEAL